MEENGLGLELGMGFDLNVLLGSIGYGPPLSGPPDNGQPPSRPDLNSISSSQPAINHTPYPPPENPQDSSPKTVVSHFGNSMANVKSQKPSAEAIPSSDHNMANDTASAHSTSSRIRRRSRRSLSHGSSIVEEIKIRKLGEELGIIFCPGSFREKSLAESSSTCSL